MSIYKLSRIAEADLAKMHEAGIETFGLHHAQDYLSGIQGLFQIR